MREKGIATVGHRPTATVGHSPIATVGQRAKDRDSKRMHKEERWTKKYYKELLSGTDPWLLSGTDPNLLSGTDPRLLSGTDPRPLSSKGSSSKKKKICFASGVEWTNAPKRRNAAAEVSKGPKSRAVKTNRFRKEREIIKKSR